VGVTGVDTIATPAFATPWRLPSDDCHSTIAVGRNNPGKLGEMANLILWVSSKNPGKSCKTALPY